MLQLVDALAKVKIADYTREARERETGVDREQAAGFSRFVECVHS